VSYRAFGKRRGLARLCSFQLSWGWQGSTDQRLSQEHGKRPEREMAFDYRCEVTRPLTLVLLVVAILGWLIAAIALLLHNQDSSRYRREIRQLRNIQVLTRAELDEQHQANGSLAELQARVVAAQQKARQVDQARAEAEAGMRRSAVRSALEAKRFGELQQQSSEVEQRANIVEARLQSLREEMTTAQAELAEARKHLLVPRTPSLECKEE